MKIESFKPCILQSAHSHRRFNEAHWHTGPILRFLFLISSFAPGKRKVNLPKQPSVDSSLLQRICNRRRNGYYVTWDELAL